jgi:hypothetical protein
VLTEYKDLIKLGDLTLNQPKYQIQACAEKSQQPRFGFETVHMKTLLRSDWKHA